MEPNREPYAPLKLGVWILATASLALAACNDDDDNNDPFDNDEGSLSVAITDAPSDQLETFTIDVVDLRLHRTNGDVIDLLDDRTRVDLANLGDEAQLLVLRNLPEGEYDRLVVVIDFSDAQIALIGEGAEAQVLAMDGLAVDDEMTLRVDFASPIDVDEDDEHRLEIDFDLAQSVAVVPGANTIALEPAVVVRVNPDTDKRLVFSGDLVRVEQDDDKFRMKVLTHTGARLFGIDCLIDGGTVFQVNGVALTGDAGLATLDGLAAGTSLEVHGRLNEDERLRTDLVIAGTGTFHGGTDVVVGNVVGRTGGGASDAVFTVLGRSTSFDHSSFQFDELFTVSTGFATTKVVRAGSAAGFDLDDVNIGQRVRVYGDLTDTSLDATSSSSVIRLLPTLVIGNADGPVSAGQLVIDVASVDLHDVSTFDWTEAGIDPPDPDALVVQLDAQVEPITTEDSELVAVRGFFRPVDDAGDDFQAISALDQDSVDDFLWVRNRLFTGFDLTLTTDPDEIEILIDNGPAMGEFALVFNGLAAPVPLPDLPVPAIRPETNAGTWVIRDRSAFDVDTFDEFDDFSAELADRFSDGNVAVQVSAFGSWNGTTNVLTAERAYVVVD